MEKEKIQNIKRIFNKLNEYFKTKNIVLDDFIPNRINYRNNGGKFCFEDYVEAMILSMLSSQMDWSRVYKNKNNLSKIFSNYDKNIILNTNPEKYIDAIKNLKIGSTSTKAQMYSLKHNILILENLDSKYNGLDNYMVSKSPKNLAIELGDGRYKLSSIGISLACEFLRNVGLNIVKPDRHLKRICNCDNLGFFDTINPKDTDIIDFFIKIEQLIGYKQYEMDFLLWNYCANGFGKICTKKSPKCTTCVIKEYCISGNNTNVTWDKEKSTINNTAKKLNNCKKIFLKKNRVEQSQKNSASSHSKKTIVEEMQEYLSDVEIETYFKTGELRTELEKKYGRKRDNYNITDYCYNRNNEDNTSKNDINFFLYLGRSEVKYVGQNYKYSGPVYCKPKGAKKDIEVGYCKNGEYIAY